jgi:hypothetical protein
LGTIFAYPKLEPEVAPSKSVPQEKAAGVTEFFVVALTHIRASRELNYEFW